MENVHNLYMNDEYDLLLFLSISMDLAVHNTSPESKMDRTNYNYTMVHYKWICENLFTSSQVEV